MNKNVRTITYLFLLLIVIYMNAFFCVNGKGDEYDSFILHGSGVDISENTDNNVYFEKPLDTDDNVEDDISSQQQDFYDSEAYIYEDSLSNASAGYSMKTSDTGISLICKWEGCRLTAYKAVSTEKYYTIGYGHYGADVTEGMTITQAKAVELLKSDVVRFEGYVNNFINKNGLSFNQNQFDALISFTYNIGTTWMSESTIRSYMLDGLDKHTDEEIRNAFGLWCKSGGNFMQGLYNRRMEEADLFLKKIDNGPNLALPDIAIDSPQQNTIVYLNNNLGLAGWINDGEWGSGEWVTAEFYIGNRLIKTISQNDLFERSDIGNCKMGFSFEVYLSDFEPGNYELKVIATNAAGSYTKNTDITIVGKPDIAIDSPKDHAVVYPDSYLGLSGWVNDGLWGNGGDVTADFYIGNKKVRTISKSDLTARSDIGNAQMGYNFEIYISGYTPGDYVLKVVANNQAGQYVEKKTIRIVGPADIALDNPVDEGVFYYSDYVHFSGWINNQADRGEIIKFYIDDKIVKSLSVADLFYREDIGFSGAFEFDVSLKDYKNGKHKVKFEVDNGVGISTITRNINVTGNLTGLLDDLRENSNTKIEKRSLTLDGSIGVNLYMNVDENLRKIPSAYVKINDTKYYLNKAKIVDGLYVFTYQVSAKQMRDDISVSLYYDADNQLRFNNESATEGVYHCTVEDYINVLKKSSDNREVELANAMDMYGKYSQQYFGYKTSLIGNVDSVNDYNLSIYNKKESGDIPEGLKYSGSSLILDSDTAIRHYYTVENSHSIDEYTFYVDGIRQTPVKKGTLYYVEISNISAPKLGNDYSIEIKSDYSTYEMQYSALSYMKKSKEKYGNNTYIYNLANALYGYFCASKQLFE